MSAQSQQHPNSLANLKPAWKKGETANPGGKPNSTPRVDVAYCKLLKMTPDEIAAFQPQDGADLIAFRQFTKAINNGTGETLAYAQEVTNRTSGKVADRLEVSTTHSAETRQAIITEAYALLFRQRTREESLASINAAYDALEAQDEARYRDAIQLAIQEDSEGISAVWSEAEKAVSGG